MRLAIYGAQGMAFGAYKAIKELFPEQEILCFIVSEMGMNPPVLGDVPVMEFHDFLAKVPQGEMDDIEV